MNKPTPSPRQRRRSDLKAFRPELPHEWRAKLKGLIKNTTARNINEAVRRGMNVYCALHEHQLNGWTLVLKKGTEEKPFPVN